MDRPGLAAGAIPTNDHLTCVFVGAPPAVLADLVQDGRPDHAMRYVRGMPGYLRRAIGPGWALIGDAGYWKDPLSAHGLTDAFRDAELLADAVTSTRGPGPAQVRALADYEARRDALARPFLDVTEKIAAYQWDLTEVRGLLIELAAVMSDEIDVLSSIQEEV